MLDVSIADSAAHECALKLLLLWRPNLESGQPIAASEPILGAYLSRGVSRIAEPQPQPAPIVSPAQPEPSPSPSTQNSNWISLKDFVVRDGKKLPPKLRLPTGEERNLSRWRTLLIELSEWLISDGALTQDKCPIIGGYTQPGCLVNLVPARMDGKAFPSNHRLSNGLYINLHHGAVDVLAKCKAMMLELGKDSATVHVKVG